MHNCSYYSWATVFISRKVKIGIYNQFDTYTAAVVSFEIKKTKMDNDVVNRKVFAINKPPTIPALKFLQPKMRNRYA